jgi:hypothetical protein
MIVTHYIIGTIVNNSQLIINNRVNEYYNYKHCK